jgi:sec-independent protein translocase protein TatB
MPQVGPLELIAVAVVALVVFGPEKLPEMARSIGRAMADFRRVVDDAKDEFQAGFSVEDEQEASHPMHQALYGSYAAPEPAPPSASSGSDGMIPIPEAPAGERPREEPDEM